MQRNLRLLFIIICAAMLEFIALSAAKFLGIELKFNYGIAFGLFNDFKYIALILSCLALAVILCLIFYKFKDFKINLALALAGGGAAANFAERLYLGFVIDYINILYSFNLADIEIILGLASAMGLYLLERKRELDC